MYTLCFVRLLIDLCKISPNFMVRFTHRCFCTDEELEAKRSAAEAKGEDPKYDGLWRDRDPADVQAKLNEGVPYTVRFKVPKGKIGK